MTAVDVLPAARPGPVEERVPEPRRAVFDWSDVPVHWVPGDPHTTHTMNTLHLFLPAGERWFIKVFKQLLPLIEDPLLHEQVRAFMSQEGQHATAHDTARRHLEEQGFDTERYVAFLDRCFVGLLGDRWMPTRFDRSWLNTRLAVIAAVEHYTAVLGQWVLEADELDELGPDPTMLDLLRWHGAEEVEHRSVAFDLYQHLCGSHALRFAVGNVVFPVIVGMVWAGSHMLLSDDPLVDRPRAWRGYGRAMKQGRLPNRWELFAAGPRYLRRGFHPSQEGDLDLALAYIARSPSHLDAADVQRARRAARLARADGRSGE